MGKVTAHSLPGLCRRAISSARSMLSACIATLKRADPLLTWTEILIISPHLPSKKIETIVAYELYVTVLTVSSENMLETEEFRLAYNPSRVDAKFGAGPCGPAPRDSLDL